MTGRRVSTQRKNRKMLANESLQVSSDPLISAPTGSGIVAWCPPWAISSPCQALTRIAFAFGDLASQSQPLPSPSLLLVVAVITTLE